MHPKPLFVRRCEQAAILTRSYDEVDLLDLARILRQLLLDERPLAITANTYRLRLRFDVVEFRPIWESLPSLKQGMQVNAAEDSLDPSIVPANGRFTILSLPLGEFLNQPAAFTPNKTIMIKHVIKYAANVAGGVHHSPRPKPEYMEQAQLSQMIFFGLPFGIRTLRAIGRISLRGLDPLVQAVTSEAQRSPT